MHRWAILKELIPPLLHLPGKHAHSSFSVSNRVNFFIFNPLWTNYRPKELIYEIQLPMVTAPSKIVLDVSEK